jgi:DNA phosphorothioation-dependent restriction protein DptG
MEELKSAYYTTGKFKHVSPKRILLFPYTTTPVNHKEIDEFGSFFSVAGEGVRDLAGVDCNEDCTSLSILERIQEEIDTCSFSDLQHIVQTVLFDENDQLHCFHPIVFYYIKNKDIAKRVKAFGQFVSDVLFDENKELGPCSEYDTSSTNVFHHLILKYLPALSATKNLSRSTYYQANDPVCKMFVKDCDFLKRNPELYSKKLPDLVKFYFLIYQLRLIELCNSPISKTTREPFFFSVAWESLSKGRQAYQAGWKRIDKKLFSMWAHVNCLEMLNYLPIEGLNGAFGYEEIRDWCSTASTEQLILVEGYVDELIGFYREAISSLGFIWDKFDSEIVGGHPDGVEGKIKLFFKLVEYQFIHDNKRRGAAERYSKWLREFASINYLKQRGPLGNTLRFSRAQLLFITRVCIGDRSDGKLRVTDLWLEFEKRGVSFDSDTKSQIIDLYNKLNLIERKSDSGDAQYVRAIF